jgi:hypothetical protein
MATPTFNHTRGDGPEKPCSECAALMIEEHFYAVIFTLHTGRMALSDEPNATLEQAMESAKKLPDPVGIVEWVKDRDPQFKEVHNFLDEEKI